MTDKLQETEDKTMDGISDFGRLGLGAVAYFRPINGPHGPLIGIFSADGTQVGSAPDDDHAATLILQNDLMPVRVH